MQDSHLEIVTTVPPERSHIAAAAILGALLLASGVVLLPFGGVGLPHNPSFLPAFGAVTFVVDLMTAVLLLGQAQLADNAAASRLGTAYLFSALIIVPHMAAFPQVMAAEPLLGRSASAVWLWVCWHGGFALLVAWYAAIPPKTPVRLALAPRILGVVAVVAVLATIASAGLPLLPSLIEGDTYGRLNTLGIGPLVVACNLAALLLVVFRLRFATTMALWLSVAMVAASVDVSVTLTGLTRFSLGWYLGRVDSLLTGLSVLGALLFESLHLYRRVGEANRYLAELATTDGLTRIGNRRAFDTTLDTEWRRAARDASELSLLMMDIDWFKRFNDRYGHPAGDQCLRNVAAAVRGALQRAADFAARYGGEEFVVILPGTDAASAALIAERVRAAVEAAAITHQDSAYGRVTVSVGAATMQPRAATDPKDLIDASDAALYRAKEEGRNRVSAAASGPAPVEARRLAGE